MKILLAQPGKLNTVPMGRFTPDALRRLGHEVEVFNLSSTWRDKAIDRLTRVPLHCRLNRRFCEAVEGARPDLMLTVFGFDFSPQSLDYLKQRGIVRACWWLNDPFQFRRSLAKAPGYDFLFSNAMGSVADYHAAGVHHAHWLPTACEPTVHRRLPPLPEYRCEVCFAGDWSPLREAWCNELARHFDLKVFGPWKKKLAHDSPLHRHLIDGFFTPDEMARMFASAEVVFNLHSWYGTWDHGTNPRLFEAAGCAACQVVDWKQDIPELFDCTGELATYTDMADMVVRVRELLHDGARRTEMGQRAQARAYAEHTYEVRMRSLLATVSGSQP